MLRRTLCLLAGGASGACGFAALGVALYAQGPAAAAAALFGAVGFGAGLLCTDMSWRPGSAQARRPAPVSADALASLFRATLASVGSERETRPGSASDRRPAQVAADALAQAAAPASALTLAAAAPSPQPAAASAPLAAGARQFASSAFGG